MDRTEAGRRGGEAAIRSENVSAAQVQAYLRGVDYPASKDKLIRTAEDQCAPESVIDLLRHIPNKEYTSPPDVGKAVFSTEGESKETRKTTSTRSLEDRRRGIYR
jgi:hypothetical protein